LCRACWHDEAVAPADESARTVVVALLANLGIVVAKLAAAIITGSAAMFAETVHSAADTGNSVLLLVAQHRSGRPAAPSGLSRGREAYFWALLAAIGVFVVGAVLAVYEGVRELLDPIPAGSFVVAYVVLAVGGTAVTVTSACDVRVRGVKNLGHLMLRSGPPVSGDGGARVEDGHCRYVECWEGCARTSSNQSRVARHRR
jgi:divalent metal cation (Fe/Co/Zn/Cd) transporter